MASKQSRSGSVVYPEQADEGKPKLFARQSFIVSGEEEEMAETILQARKLVQDRRRSVAEEAGGAAAAALPRRPSIPESAQAAAAAAAPTTAPVTRRKSSVLHRVPDKLRCLLQQSDENGVQQKATGPPRLESEEASTSGRVEESDSSAPVSPRQGLCHALLSCFKAPEEGGESGDSGAKHGGDAQTEVVSTKQPSPAVPVEVYSQTSLLGPQEARFKGRKLLALDLDETLVHSSFKPEDGVKYDYILDIEVDGVPYNVYVLKRPGAEEFLARVSKKYEVIVFTASLAPYANPLLDELDPEGHITGRLFRQHCVFHEGYYVKDLTLLRHQNDLYDTIIVDNSPMAYMFQPENAIDCTSWFRDPHDTELYTIGDFLDKIDRVPDCRNYLEYWRAGSQIEESM